MAKDFRTDQIRIAKIIGSGAFPPGSTVPTGQAAGSGPAAAAALRYPHLGLLIYSSSAAYSGSGVIKNSGEDDGNGGMLDNIGHDAWMVISGSTNNTAIHGGDRSAGSSVVFIGDVVVSGTIWGQRQIIDVDNTVPGDFHVYNDAYVSGSFAAGTTTVEADGPKDLIVADHLNSMVSFRQFDTPFPISAPAHHADVFFWVSGSIGGDGAARENRGVACFDGDVMISGTLTTGPCTTFRDSIRLADLTSSNPPTLIFGPTDNCAWTPASASLGWEYLTSATTSWFSLVNSASSTGGGIRLITPRPNADPRPANINAGFVVSGADGSIAIDPGSELRLTGGSWHGDSNFGAKIFATASLAKDGVDNEGLARGVQIQYITTGAATNPANVVGSHHFLGGVITASAGIFLPPASESNKSNVGQVRGIMFAGGLNSGAPGDAGLYYNDTKNQNTLLGGALNTLVLTASNTSSKLKIGAGSNIDIYGQGSLNIHAQGTGGNKLIITSSGGTDAGMILGSEKTLVRGTSGIELNLVTGSTGGVYVSAPRSVQGIHLNASGTSGGRVISGMGIFGLTLDATGSQIAMLGDVHMLNNLTVHGDFIKGHIISASVTDPLFLLNSGSLTKPSGGGVAIASGSTILNQSIVFGRDTANENTFLIGRKDVEDGNSTDLAGAILIPVAAAGVRTGAGMTLTASLGDVGGANAYHVTMSNEAANGAGVGGDVHIIAGPGTGASPQGGLFFLSASVSDFKGDLLLSGTKTSVKVGTTLYFDETADNNGPYSIVVNEAQNLLNIGLGAGKLKIGTNFGFDEPNVRFGIGTASPSYTLDVANQQAGNDIPTMRLKQDSNHTRGPILRLEHNAAGTAADVGDSAGEFVFYANNASTTTKQFSRIVVDVADPTATAEFGVIKFLVTNDGVENSTPLKLHGQQVLILSGGGVTSIDESSGTDIAFYVSGTVGSMNSAIKGTSLFGGDLVVSGNAEFVSELTASVVNVIGALTASDLKLPRLSLTSSTADITFYDATMFIQKDSNNLTFSDSALGLSKTLTQLAALSVVDNSDVFSVTHGAPSYVVTTGSFSFDTNARATNATPAAGGPGEDTYFFVSGSRGCRGTSVRGLTLFAGDMHVSGTLTSDDTSFGGSFDDAYDTPSGGGSTGDGLGALVNVDGRPIQFYSGSEPQTYSTSSLLVISGGIRIRDLQIGSDGLAGSAGMLLNLTASGGTLQVNTTSTTRGAAEIFKITGASGNLQIAAHATEGKIAFAQESSTYIRLDNASSPKNLEVYNTTSTGKISLITGASSGAQGTIEVQADVLPTVDNSYDLGSGTKRWANLYTGDLHLKNDRGDWTIYEEREMLVVVNNITGKKYKMNLTPLEDEE